MNFEDVKVGDTVIRNLCGLHMLMTVTEVDEKLIHCGPWTFSRLNGAEVDEDLGWDGVTVTGSYLVKDPE